MKVYVVVVGSYEDIYVSGVYTSPEAAMNAHPIPAKASSASNSASGRWHKAGNAWLNGLAFDDDDTARIYEYQLLG